MDARVNQLARELTDAIAAAVGDDARVAACREKATAEGLDLRLSLEAVISFVNRSAADQGDGAERPRSRKPPVRPFEMSANDRRFLKSLRISADEPTQKEVE
jgi:hypothetical protein